MLYDKRWEETITPVVEEEEWRTILRRAADIIERGWTQRKYSERNAKGVPIAFCAVGALSCASAPDNIINSRAYGFAEPATDAGQVAYRKLLEHVNSTIPTKGYLWWKKPATRYSSVPDWNDDPDRTKEEVAKAMREAADAV